MGVFRKEGLGIADGLQAGLDQSKTAILVGGKVKKYNFKKCFQCFNC